MTLEPRIAIFGYTVKLLETADFGSGQIKLAILFLTFPETYRYRSEFGGFISRLRIGDQRGDAMHHDRSILPKSFVQSVLVPFIVPYYSSTLEFLPYFVFLF